jgi:dihydropteroate synthase
MSLPKISAEEAKRLVDQGAVLIDIRARKNTPGSAFQVRKTAHSARR